MYRTLVVDDEQLMRQYLSTTLSLIDQDFRVTGIACDGFEAVELLKRQTFDLVITDIKMPGMDGLNLANYIFDASLKTKVIIISGYNEFEYAQLAIRYGVSDYLLKPLSDDAMAATLGKIKKLLCTEHTAQSLAVSMDDFRKYNDTEMKAAFLSAIINNASSTIQSLYNLLQERKILFTEQYSSVLLLRMDELHLLLQEKQTLENTSYLLEFIKCCTRFCSTNQYTAVSDEKGNMLILLTAVSEEKIALAAESVYRDFCQHYWPNESIKINASYGYIVKDLLRLADSYTSALESLALTLRNVHSPITSNYYISQKNFLNELKTICASLSNDYISKNETKIMTDLSIYLTLFQDEINVASVLKYGTYLIRYLIKECNIKTEYIHPAFQELTVGIDRTIQTGNLSKDTVLMLFFKILKVLDHEESLMHIPETTSIVAQAKEYICTHYKEPISLAMVADSLNVTPSYLSDLFHKNIGEPYTKFLTRIRMEQALLILRSNPNEKIYKIAEKTGFVSSKHFNAVFKKYYGFTPTEYISNNLL
ncbi:response regulator transcription factor [Anaerocolumna xylanovorans]|uniref:Stage 0 sporulation protein A homolog n=1 Tax=Anaerocolumna xylanovorans DSM 12503 TaxID=1121345 RepID=A0A1M7Y414_9FIRM|nr:response regulator [Anaerocolumna xylanovorans]SHO47005.1 two-component system, response regulator YesN [Anaerocolumna xylanovorans DSM 12503]